MVSCVTFGIGFVRLAFHFFSDCVNQAIVSGERNIQIKFYGKFMPLQKILILVPYVAYLGNASVIPSLVKKQAFFLQEFPYFSTLFRF